MPGTRRETTRSDLPESLTAETLRHLPLSVLRPLSRPGNGVLSAEEQQSFDAALHQIMTETANRVSGQIDRVDWSRLRRDLSTDARARDGRPARSGGRPSRVDEQLRRAAERIDAQVGVAESLAPGVDWSFAEADPARTPVAADGSVPPGTAPAGGDGTHTGDDTVADLEQRLTDQVELVQVMSEIADVSKRTYALEKQRDLQNTRGVFFGLVVSVAVLVAGWAPLVAARDWEERGWVIGLTLATCVLAGLVYAVVRRRQDRRDDAEAQDSD